MMFVTLFGLQLGGLTGAIVTTLAIMARPPPDPGSHAPEREQPRSRLGRAVRGGLGPIAIGLTLSSGWIIAQSSDHDWRGTLLTLATVALMLRTRLNPVG